MEVVCLILSPMLTSCVSTIPNLFAFISGFDIPTFLIESVFMARRGIPMIAFPRVRTIYMYIYIYILVSLTQVCVVYVVKEVTSFPGAWSINGRGA